MKEGAITARPAETAAQAGEGWIGRWFGKLLGFNEAGLLLVVLAFGVGTAILEPAFVSQDNLLNVARVSAFTFIMSCGLTFCFVGGGLDLSVGSIFGLGGAATALALTAGTPVPLSILIGLAAGCGLGLLNGWVITRFSIPALIVTLGMQFSARGILMVITKGTPISPLPDEFKQIAQGSWLGMPNPILIAAAVGVLSYFVLEHTKFGYAVHGVGGNMEAARVSGIQVERTQVWLYVITGVASAFAGLLMASRLGAVSSNSGTGLELTAISAVIIGGTSLFGGIGTLLGTLLGSILLNMITNSIVLIGVDAYWQNIVIGVVIVFAVGIDQYRRALLWRSRKSD